MPSKSLRATMISLLCACLVLVGCTAPKQAPAPPGTSGEWRTVYPDLESAMATPPNANSNPGAFSWANPIRGSETMLVWTERGALGIDENTGAIRWRKDFGAEVCATSEGEVGGKIALATSRGKDSSCRNIALLNTADGSLEWQREIPRFRRYITTQIALTDKALVISGVCGGYSSFRRSDGEILSNQRSIPGASGCRYAASDGETILAHTPRGVVTISAETGKVESRTRGQYLPTSWISTDPMILSTAPPWTQRRKRLGPIVDFSQDVPVVSGPDDGGTFGIPDNHYRAGRSLWLSYEFPVAWTGVIDLDTHQSQRITEPSTELIMVGVYEGKVVFSDDLSLVFLDEATGEVQFTRELNEDQQLRPITIVGDRLVTFGAIEIISTPMASIIRR